jgi:hypothetical protein
MGTLVYDRPVRERVLEGQRRRLVHFAPEKIEARLTNLLAGLGAG